MDSMTIELLKRTIVPQSVAISEAKDYFNQIFFQRGKIFEKHSMFDLQSTV